MSASRFVSPAEQRRIVQAELETRSARIPLSRLLATITRSRTAIVQRRFSHLTVRSSPTLVSSCSLLLLSRRLRFGIRIRSTIAVNAHGLSDAGAVLLFRRLEVDLGVLVLLVETGEETSSARTAGTVVRSSSSALFLHSVDGVGDVEGFAEAGDAWRSSRCATSAVLQERRVERHRIAGSSEAGCRGRCTGGLLLYRASALDCATGKARGRTLHQG